MFGSVVTAMPLASVLAAALTTVAFVLRERTRGSTAPSTGTADVAVGVVRRIAEDDSTTAIGERSITIDVETSTGQSFTGRLRYRCGDPVASRLRPGTPVLVAFDPAAREHLSLPDEITAVRAAFDQMLIRKGLLTVEQRDVIRYGTRSRGVITAMQPTGETREDYREVELDLMVTRPGGGQFPAHETTLIPVSALADIGPGSVVTAYYRPDDESTVTVCVAPS
jgi:hypothetical protein